MRFLHLNNAIIKPRFLSNTVKHSRKKVLAINGRFLAQEVMTGVQRYAHEVVRGLDRLIQTHASHSSDVQVELLVPPDARLEFATETIQVRKIGHGTGHFWEQCELPLHCRGKLLFTPAGGAPLIHRDHVITIHDVGYVATPQAYSRSYRKWYEFTHRSIAKRARHVLTDSEFSKSELQRCFGISCKKVTVAHLGAEHVWSYPSDCRILSRFNLRPFSYILGASSFNPNKNFRGLVEGYRLLTSDLRLVIAGAKNRDIFGDQCSLPANATWTGYVSDSELRALYESAACFVFPSFYEGFGLPPLEAMALGCPIVISRAASLPEIGGNVATYCDPSDPKSIAEAIRSALTQRVNRDELRRVADSFTWTACVQKTWAVLTRELSGETGQTRDIGMQLGVEQMS